LTLVEFVLELNPMKSQSMKEGLHEVHHHQHSNGGSNKDEESEEELQN
jgi:hypothetical protein